MPQRSLPQPPCACAGEDASDAPGSCRTKVRRAYAALCGRGQPERFAFEAALEVYRWHHPETAREAAAQLVATWVWNGVSH